jgi:hypothetical protein
MRASVPALFPRLFGACVVHCSPVRTDGRRFHIGLLEFEPLYVSADVAGFGRDEAFLGCER